jgi:hypothetical protein
MTTTLRISRELTALTSVLLLITLGDYLLWGAWPGLALGIFVLLTAAALLLNRSHAWNRASAVALLLLLPTAAQTGIEQSFSNLLVLIALLVVLFGETTFGSLRAGWARWSEAIWSFCKPISGWLWLLRCTKQVPNERRLLRRGVDGLLRIILPAVAVGVVFALLLGFGNAILGHWLHELLASFFHWLAELDLSVGRFVLWIFLGTFSLTLLRPTPAPEKPRIWTGVIPEFPAPTNVRIALGRTIAILVLLNLLFFAANTADALYLWTNAKLPAGVGYSEFVHSGVWSLSAAVVLSALMIASLFQQNTAVRSEKLVRGLSLFWIAQNLILIAGVFLRLIRYVEAYQLSELRVYVGCFLVLVTAGFGSLVFHILTPRGFNRLLLVNVITTFGLFFVLQFPDVAKWVAEYNVARWQQDSKRTLDVAYLNSLGLSAVPSLITVAETSGRPEAHAAFQFIQARKGIAPAIVEGANWRTWQSRKFWNARQLLTHQVRTRG